MPEALTWSKRFRAARLGDFNPVAEILGIIFLEWYAAIPRYHMSAGRRLLLCANVLESCVRRHTQLGVEEKFFKEPRDSSRRKLQIVTEYFGAYMNVLARNREVGYADLFAGPGLYDNGEKSVPVVICERVIADERLRKFVRLWFNEADPKLYPRLKRNVESIPGLDTLKHRPSITKIIISKQLAPRIERLSLPTFVFADPCGYKGISLRLITAALRGFGNDCLFFFNYNRVNMKLGYPVMDESIDEFFEHEPAETLRAEIRTLAPAERERRVLGTIHKTLREAGALPLAFAFRTRYGGGTSHHLVFVSKSPKGVGIMKRLMNQASSEIVDGVGSWDFDPKDMREFSEPLLPFSGLDEVRQRLLLAFADRIITFHRIIAEEAPLTQYTDSNYRDALLELEQEHRVLMDPPADKRPFMTGGLKRTLAARTKITFPR